MKAPFECPRCGHCCQHEAALAEREACAKVCEENSLMFGDSALIGVCRTNASRIRSRGEE